MPRKKARRRTPRKRQAKTDARGYGSDWQQLRTAFLSVYPLCVACWVQGKVIAATQVDHIIPFTDKHDGRRLDWDNLQSLCTACHAGPKAAIQAHANNYDVWQHWMAYLKRIATVGPDELHELPEHLAVGIMDAKIEQDRKPTTYSLGWDRREARE